MATMRANSRLQVGSAPWISEERSTALQLVHAEAEEFSFSARNDVDWLNEHMAEIFSKNQVNVAEIFKTPGKLRGKTPRTARKANPLEVRAPLSDVFSATSRAGTSPFKQAHFERPPPTFQVAEDEPQRAEEEVVPHPAKASPPKTVHNTFDSGYHGSQPEESTQRNEPEAHQPTPRVAPEKSPELAPVPVESESESEGEDDDINVVILGRDSEERETTEAEGSFHSAKEEQTRKLVEVAEDQEVEKASSTLEQASHPVLNSPTQTRLQPPPSPRKRSPERNTPAQSPAKPLPIPAEQLPQPIPVDEDEPMDDAQSPSEGSSPLRPIRKKSSFSFASLPPREPLTSKQSIGNRVSRTSHIDQSRTSYFGRLTGGKSLGNARQEDRDEDDMDIDELTGPDVRDDTGSKMTRLHNKTSTQRLQDQISMLGQSQSGVRPSKSFANAAPSQTQPAQPQLAQASQPPSSPRMTRQKSPMRKAPGAFPEDEDSWIGPPTTAAAAEPSIFSPRPQMAKSHSTDIMEGVQGKDSVSGSQFSIPKRGEHHRRSPAREPVIPERTTSTLGHIKSVSTSVLRSPKKAGDSPAHKKGISVSNPNPSIHSNDAEATTPPKSPSRSYRGSPLKAAKDKFSSILKTSRGLFASSAAVSAEAKSTLSPVSSRVALNHQPSFEDVVSQSGKNPSYPNLDYHGKAPDTPGKASSRKTRASTEREERRKEEEAREAKEAKIAQKMTDQLEKARMKVKEEARVYQAERERVATMQKEVAARKDKEKSQVDIPRATRTSPRKTKAQLEAEGIAAAAESVDELSGKDHEMSDASAMPPPAIPRQKSQIGRPGAKRPMKPTKEPLAKAKPPTVIRVDTGSQRGHQYHPSNSTLAASLQDSLASASQPAPPQLRHKASTSSIQSKSSTNSFKSAASKALEAAARKKEQDELAAQRKKEAKLEVERQRAAIKEEERRKEELQRRQEAERQREMQRERERAAAAADAKKAASRQAIEKRRLEMEKAKETRAPPPAIRPQPSGDLSKAMLHDKALPSVPGPRVESAQPKPPRMANPSAQRSQEEVIRPANTAFNNTTKAPPKRPLQQDSEDHHSRPTIQRNGPSYQHNEQQSKRRKTSQEFDDDEDMTEPQPKMTAPPIRQSSSRPKEMQTKSLFPSGYAAAPPPGSLQRSTLISQHNMSQAKTTHPMDMAQVSKAPIPFASGSSQSHNQNHKTPARPGAPAGGAKSGAKSARSSPRYQNGENIELPEIHTDSEDEDSGDENFDAPSWADSPAIRNQLVKQETVDPATVFGQPGPLNMEEVFSKSKDRWHKFRARTSSANWTGQDRLTEDEVKKDLEGRDRMRRQGGWTYDSLV